MLFEEGVYVLLNFQELRSTLRSTAFPISNKANALSTTNKRPGTRTSKTLGYDISCFAGDLKISRVFDDANA